MNCSCHLLQSKLELTLNTLSGFWFRQALLLMQGGVDVNSQNELGESPLIYLSITLKRKENQKIRFKLAKLLIDFGSNVNIQDYRGMTVLIHSSILNQDDLVQLLLSFVSKLNMFIFILFSFPLLWIPKMVF